MTKSNKKFIKRLCLIPNVKICIGKYGHRGCCSCFEYNYSKGNEDWECSGPYWLEEESN